LDHQPRVAKTSRFHRERSRPRLVAVSILWLTSLVLASAVGVAAHQGHAPGSPRAASQQDARPPVQLLGAKEGREIVAAAREHEPTSRAAQDCSHFVHEIYARAGLSYPYASSFDLYAGGQNFARVKNAQAGDLIVWPGHVGIVANPKEHLFYSLVRSGIGTSDYLSRYWRARGKARFYRYVVASRATMLATNDANGGDSDGGEVHAGARGSAATHTNRGSATTKASARKSAEGTSVFDPVDRSVESAGAVVPRSIVIAEGRRQPTREDVSVGISELSSASGGVLRGDVAQSAVPVVVFEQFQVKRVELKRDHGWALVDLQLRASWWGGEADLAGQKETVRWELRRGKTGWEAVSPNDRTFVPRDVAMRNIAARLAELTQQGGGDTDALRREEARLTRLLDVLLEGDRERGKL
jgi:NlpC/P60 family